jgi:copper(I)-binding protein
VIRPQLSLLAAGLAILIGMAGLVRGAVPRAVPVSAGSGLAAAASPLVVGGAYVREPATADVAAAYFTIFNTSNRTDVLTAVTSGAGGQVTMHTDVNGSMALTPGGLTIPAHGSVVLSPGKGHVMLEKLYGPLRPGQTVNLQLDFAAAGTVLVTAPVIAIGAPAPAAPAPG